MARITGSRMTRSQSRQASNEPSKIDISGGSAQKRLDPLSEETFTPGFNRSRQVIPESPENHEGHTNVSGTTLGPNDAEPMNSQIGMKIMTQLPFIQEQACLVMNLLAPPNLNPDSIPAEAKKFRDSSHPNTRRLTRSIQGLNDELQDSPLASHGQAILDIADIRGLMSPVSFEKIAPDLHMANCAMLAREIFSPHAVAPMPQVIQDLDAYFPACLLNGFGHSSTSRAIGESSAEENTFSLSLGIRTQFFIMELERRQKEHDFDPISILRQIFCLDILPSEDNSQGDPASFRGFNLPGVFQDEDGHLPETLSDKLQISVSDRFNDLYEEISESDEVDVSGLKKAYKWRSFERDLARWLHARSQEIRDDIRRLSNEQAQLSPASRRLTPAPIKTPNIPQPLSVPPVQSNQSPQREAIVSKTPDLSPEAAKGPRQPTKSPHNVPKPSSSGQAEQPATADPSRRKSKSNYRDASSFARLKKRMEENSRQNSLSGATSRPSDKPPTTDIVHREITSGAAVVTRASEPREIPGSPEQRDLAAEDDDFTYVNNDEESDLSYGHERDMMTSTSPSASARINRVSHNPDRHDSLVYQTPHRSIQQNSMGHESTVAPRFFNQKQDHASKVSPITDTQSTERRRADPVEPSSKKRQRSLDESDDDSGDDSDDDFEQDTRGASHRPEKRPRFQASLGGEKSPHEVQSKQDDSSRASRGPQTSTRATRDAQIRDDSEDLTDGETTNPPPSASQVPSASQAPTTPSSSYWANLSSQVNPDRKPRKPNSRWTTDEDERLLYLMELYGTSYAMIKQKDGSVPTSEGGPLLESRSQVNCKDRARNLKKKYRRDGEAIPKGLEGVNA